MNDLEGADNASDLPLELLHIESAVWSRRGTLQDSRRPDSTETMFDGVSWLFQKDRLDRKLQRKHLTGIAFSGTVGIGFFVSSGQFIGISGSPGSTIAFLCAGFIVVSVMRSLAELVSVRPVSGALLDYPDTFVDEALGYATGVIYWLGQCASMATLTAAAARAADGFENTPLQKKDRAGIIAGLYLITLFSNLCGVKLYGRIGRVVKIFKLLLFIGLCILMILVRAGVGQTDLELPDNQRSFTFAPELNFLGASSTELTSPAADATTIPGEWGQFLGLWTCTIYAIFATMGSDIVIVSAGEAESPRRDLPPATRFMYLASLGFYFITSILVGLNVNFNEPGLFHPWANVTADPQSPFILAIKYTSIEALPAVLNACFLISAYTAGNTALFASSRTLFSLARVYGGKFWKNTVGRTNNGHTPVLAIVICSAFGLLAFLGVEDTAGHTFNQPILTLAAFFTGAMCCVYASECVAFLRFKRGLTLHERNGTFSRDSVQYTSRGHYRAHWQPFWAWAGLIGCILIIVSSGWPAIYLLQAKQGLGEAGDVLKPSSLLAADVVGSYSAPVLFAALYLSYKFRHRTSFRQFREFERAYFLPEFDIFDPKDEVAYSTGGSQATWRKVIREIWSMIK